MKNASVMMLCLVLTTLRAAEANTSTSELALIKQATDQFMTSLNEGATNEAFAALFKRYWPRKGEALTEAQSLAMEFRRASSQVEPAAGKSIPGRYEFLGTRQIGMAYVILVYVQKYEFAALPVAFLFYHGEDAWVLNNLTAGVSAEADMDSLAVAGALPPELNAVKLSTDQCVASFSSGQRSDAFDSLFERYWPLKQEARLKAESLASEIARVSNPESGMGKWLPGSYEFLGARRVGETYVNLFYDQKLEREDVMIAFTFYKRPEGWLLVKAVAADANQVVAVLRKTEPKVVLTEVDLLKGATDECMTLLSKGQTSEAFTNLYQRYWPNREEARFKAAELAGKVRALEIIQRYDVGKQLAEQYEFVGSRSLGTTCLTLFYLQKHERGASPVSFEFYKRQDKWFLSNERWGNDAEPELTLWTVENKPSSADLVLLKQAADQCMTSLSKGEIRESLTNLFQRYWTFEEEALLKAESLASEVIVKTSQLETKIGKYLPGRFELVDMRRLGTAYVKLVYIQKHEFGGVAVNFIFLKGQEKWFLRGIHFDNDPHAAMWTVHSFGGTSEIPSFVIYKKTILPVNGG